MKLVDLYLSNFQGIRSLQISFDGRSATIFGDNATGKTTVYNAITWLLFDKAGNGAKGFNPKTKGADGDLHHLEHSAEATFLVDDRRITLKKTFREVYKKKRGSASEEFDGHTVDYFLDGVPVKEKEYTAVVLSACGGDAEIPKLLTMPDYFSEGIPWESRRRILLAVCGDVSDDAVITSQNELRDLLDVLLMPGSSDRRYTVDEYRRVAGARRTEINRRLDAIPVQIAEAERAIPEIGGASREELDSAVLRLTDTHSRLLTERAEIESGSTVTADLRRRIAEVECTKAEARSRHITEQAHVNDALNEELREAQKTLADVEMELGSIKSDMTVARTRLERMKATREDLLAEYDRVSAETWDEAEAVCPTCHRPLPEEDAEHLHEKFNLRKSRRLEEINARGKREASRAMIEEIEASLAGLDERMREIPARREELEAAIRELEARRVAPIRFEETNAYHAYELELASLRERLENGKHATDEAVAAVNDRIWAVEAELRERNAELARIDLRDTQKARIGELEAEEKKLAVEFEKLEYGLYLCDLFTRTKVSYLTEHVSAHFKTVRFRLFREQINGGLAEDCEVMIPTADGRMVPYAFANSAARINAGLEIIDVLSRHYGVEMPIVVDNAESVTSLAKVTAQIIRLYVSEEDKCLRVVNE